ncbi:hypothetical protein Poly21_43110 [Allorhodopirellula heiligendammensis]|uniref:Uncharacterized protein n=1 Tax=Allorhodopirellula heiligendammensis TaxID=2714739 RepID=A0A5C6BFJ2_9BACT|nr:hypothetical protein Poly21_43110 [Allorhodopirellula heiligendammensis]
MGMVGSKSAIEVYLTGDIIITTRELDVGCRDTNHVSRQVKQPLPTSGHCAITRIPPVFRHTELFSSGGLPLGPVGTGNPLGSIGRWIPSYLHLDPQLNVSLATE